MKKEELTNSIYELFLSCSGFSGTERDRDMYIAVEFSKIITNFIMSAEIETEIEGKIMKSKLKFED